MDPATPDEFVAPADIPRVSGVFGSALQLNGGSPASYVLLPQGIVSGLTDFTVAAWVNPAATPNWSRVWDFGTGETAYMFLTVSAGGTNNPRFAITVSGNGNEQRLDAPDPLPLSTWTHLAVTLSGTTGTLYVNGAAVGAVRRRGAVAAHVGRRHHGRRKRGLVPVRRGSARRGGGRHRG
jgi:uncharacterized protein